MFSRSISFALLVCGQFDKSITAARGGYPRIYTDYLTNSLPKDSLVQFTLDPYDVVDKMEYPSEDKIDSYNAIFITGSLASAYEDKEWINKLVAYVAHIAKMKPHIKLIGICFGHQIIARALGGSVENSGFWEVGPTTSGLTDMGRRIFGVPAMTMHEMHHDHVSAIPNGCYLLGSSGACPNQGMVGFTKRRPDYFMQPATTPFELSPLIADIQILTIQGHVEYTEPIMTDIIKYCTSVGIISSETAADAMRRRYMHTDGISVVAPVIWGMVGVEGDGSTKIRYLYYGLMWGLFFAVLILIFNCNLPTEALLV